MSDTLASENTVSLKSLYESYSTNRQPYLHRGRECAKYTIPALLPPEGSTSATKLYQPYQSFGARGVNNLAAKFLLTQLPPNSPFFRLTVDDYMLKQMTGRDGMRAAVEEALNSMERSVMMGIESSNIRTATFEAMKLLLATGNALVHLAPQGGMKVFRLDRYVAKRDPMGNLLETITKETISALELPAAHRLFLSKQDSASSKAAHEDIHELYTCVRRTTDGWDVWQEVGGIELPDTRGTYPPEKSPWLALRYIAQDGEDYGRGFVEEYIGDIKSLEALRKAIVQGAAAAAKVLFLVKPNSTTKMKVLAESESGDIREGNAEDVTVLHLDKAADFRIAAETAKEIQESLAYAFMLNSAIQRNGERVTAEEIRTMVAELETAQGGAYSTLSQEFQLPLLVVKMHQMEAEGKLPALPKGIVKPLITTGIEAIGRGNDFTKLQQMLSAIQPLGPEAIQQRLNVADYIKRIGTSVGIDMKGLIFSDEEVAQQQQQQQMQQMIQQLGPNAVTQLGGMAKQGMANEAPPQ